MKLREVASVVRSKNAGPFMLTLDVLFRDQNSFDRFVGAQVLTAERVGSLFGVPPGWVKIIVYPPALAVKVVFPREVSAGSRDDVDVLGAQQHGPLLDLEF